jgi:hypothetical protein
MEFRAAIYMLFKKTQFIIINVIIIYHKRGKEKQLSEGAPQFSALRIRGEVLRLAHHLKKRGIYI